MRGPRSNSEIGGGTICDSILGGTRHFFLLTLCISKNIGERGGARAPATPTSRSLTDVWRHIAVTLQLPWIAPWGRTRNLQMFSQMLQQKVNYPIEISQSLAKFMEKMSPQRCKTPPPPPQKKKKRKKTPKNTTSFPIQYWKQRDIFSRVRYKFSKSIFTGRQGWLHCS